MCPAGSTNATAVLCPAGTYSDNNTFACLFCPAGRFGVLEGMTSSLCSGSCAPGRFGLAGANNSQCTGPCEAGCYCPAGSNTTCPAVCPLGSYSEGGAVDANCTPCPAGKYGGATQLKTAACSGAS